MKGRPYYLEELGFDYGQAVRELNQQMSYEEIAFSLGYGSRVSVINLIAGAVPAHDKGEALYILYVETFRRKPPARRKPFQIVQSTEQVSTA